MGVSNSENKLSLVPSAVTVPDEVSPCPSTRPGSGVAAEEAGKLLQWFLGELKGFIVETQFKSGEFRKYAESLGRFLSAMNRVVEDIKPYNRHVAKQLQFAWFVLDAMKEAASRSRKYNFWGRNDHFLVINLIELNVAFLALCDPQGMLDRLISGHEEKLTSYWKLVCEWNESFKRIANVPGETRTYLKARDAKQSVHILF
ncbi:hypothetical protein HF325_002909 [Metschnikowia pulcherrima]|uniref:Uncharacterized protein n=1 Tax=Metschnikowia pulcherrima TaxID=27326 RepID=A0A8H7GQS3_9ASCO|nr:hypothetical protein HF325_002909 [Metschnikowia pulcherrima]